MSFSQDREADMMIKVRDSCAVKFFIILSSHINSGARDTPLSLYVCNSWNICIQYLQMFVDTCKNSHTCESRWLFSLLSWNIWPSARFSLQWNGTVVYGQWFGYLLPKFQWEGRSLRARESTAFCLFDNQMHSSFAWPTLLHRDQWPPGCSVLE